MSWKEEFLNETIVERRVIAKFNYRSIRIGVTGSDDYGLKNGIIVRLRGRQRSAPKLQSD